MTDVSAALVMLLLAVIGLSGALLYQWRVSQRRLEARTAELRTLSDAVRAIASAALNEDELCRLVYQQAAQIADVADFQIGYSRTSIASSSCAIAMGLSSWMGGATCALRTAPCAGCARMAAH
jgi:uncharacterized protein HemX